MRKFWAILLSVLMVLSMASCGNHETTETEPVTEENVEGIVIPEDQVISLYTEEMEKYLAEAKDYNVEDYSYTVKTSDNVAKDSGIAKLSWTIPDAKEVSTQTLTIEDAYGTKQEFSVSIKRNGDQAYRVYNLIPGTEYTMKVEVKYKDGEILAGEGSFKTKEGPRILTADGITNFRDIGGYKTQDGKTVKYGMVFRCAKMNDVRGLGQSVVLDLLGIKSEFDLRNVKSENDAPVESALDGTPGYNYVILSAPSYVDFFSGSKADVVREEVMWFADENNYPLVFHCLAGADRTGSLSLFILALLGVSENDLVIDYELTPSRERQGHTAASGGFYDFPGLMNCLKSQPGIDLREKAEFYAVDVLGIAREDVQKIRDLMLE